MVRLFPIQQQRDPRGFALCVATFAACANVADVTAKERIS
jgi:hypothetical protein